MPISQELLEILVCPQCHGDLTYDRAAEKLICSACRLRYSIVDDIPVMLIDEGDKWVNTALESLPVPPPAR